MSFRATVGIEITDQFLRMGIAKRKKGVVNLLSSGVTELPQGIVQNGMIKDAQRLVTKLKDLRKSLKIHGRRKVALCIPARLLYGTSVRLASLGRDARKNEFKKFIAKNIPELSEDLLMTSRSIGQEKQLLCVRKDVVSSYIAACRQAGFVVRSMVTLPMIVAGGSVQDGAIVVSLGASSSVTVMQGGWIVDESAAGLGDENTLLKEAGNMAVDWQADGHPIKRWLVAGPDAFVRSIEKQLLLAPEPKTVKKDAKTAPQPTVTVEKFAGLTEKKLEWLGVCGALVPSSPTAAFIPASFGKKLISAIVLLVSLAAIAASAMVIRQYLGM